MSQQLEPDFAGVIGTDVAHSQPWWRTPPAAEGPNVLVVVLDDMGWSDFGCFGSEIDTPTIDSLAESGLRYTNFHVTPLCSPTRASLLTGKNHHSVSMGFLSDTDTGFPNSRGEIPAGTPTMPGALRDAGLGTYMVGKWHLLPLHEATPAGPFHNWPLARGYDRYFGFLDGCTDQYQPELYEDHRQLTAVEGEPHVTTRLVDRAIDYLTQHVTYRGDSPFFLNLSLGATHAPFQAPRQYIDKYVERFGKGWDAVREERLARQVELGLAPAGTTLTDRPENVPAWDSLSEEEQRLHAHHQAAFAGFLEHADAELGRVLAALDELGQLSDTMVLVLSDNGATSGGLDHGAVDTNRIYGGYPPEVAEQQAELNQLGGHTGGAHYARGWAMAGNTPFRRYKEFPDLGGVRSPMVMSWPRGIGDPGGIRTQFSHVIDLPATILDAVGAAGADEMDGRSLLPTVHDPSAPAPRSTQYWEMFGHRALWHDGWRAVATHAQGADYDRDSWRLYDTAHDFAETTDLADREPERLQQLKDMWWQEAEKHHVLPLDDRTLQQLLALRTPKGFMTAPQVVLRPRSGHVPFATTITGTDRSMRVTATLTGRRRGEEGVLLSSGSSQGGYVLYIQDGRLVFEHHWRGERRVCAADVPVPVGDAAVGFLLIRRQDRSARVALLHGDEVVGEVLLEATSGHLSFWGMDVGRDVGHRVSEGYTDEFAVPDGVIDTVVLDFLEDEPLDELARMLMETE